MAARAQVSVWPCSSQWLQPAQPASQTLNRLMLAAMLVLAWLVFSMHLPCSPAGVQTANSGTSSSSATSGTSRRTRCAPQIVSVRRSRGIGPAAGREPPPAASNCKRSHCNFEKQPACCSCAPGTEHGQPLMITRAIRTMPWPPHCGKEVVLQSSFVSTCTHTSPQICHRFRAPMQWAALPPQRVPRVKQAFIHASRRACSTRRWTCWRRRPRPAPRTSSSPSSRRATL